MLLIHGIRGKELARHHLPGQCRICEEANCVQLIVEQRYVHFFWLPLFPLPKRGKTVCTNCGHEEAHKDLAIGIKHLFNDLRKHERTPIWMFTGSAILAVAIPLLVQAIVRHDQHEADLLNAPMVGDIWTIKLGYKHYTMYRVEEVRTDSVYVTANAHEVENAGVMTLAEFQIGSLTDFTGDRIGYARRKLVELQAHGPIHSISREQGKESAQ